MSTFMAELLGTMFLIILGDGVVANVLLNKSKGQNSGWIVITTAWAMAVFIGVGVAGWISGAHLNPAVTIAVAVTGGMAWGTAVSYIAAQMIGAFLGAVIVWLAYLPHWEVTENADLKLAVFCTAPAIRNVPANVICEIIGTFVLVCGVNGILDAGNAVPPWGVPIFVAFLVWVIGLALGGPTGYAINPARDLGPRLAHFVLPIPGKRDPDWGYAWIPVIAPIIGGILGALVYNALW
ncbi:MAG: glycerol transporter [Anaerolineae bacterium SM23_84]|nr:MAG: glycerol transporter [Anaerolineae bacterium SM23_84]